MVHGCSQLPPLPTTKLGLWGAAGLMLKLPQQGERLTL